MYCVLLVHGAYDVTKHNYIKLLLIIMVINHYHDYADIFPDMQTDKMVSYAIAVYPKLTRLENCQNVR